MHDGTRHLTVALTADEANAAVEAIGYTLMSQGEELGHGRMDCPGDLIRLGQRAARVGAFAEIGKALRWRKHWGPSGGTPDAVTAPEAVWIDLLGVLQSEAEGDDRPYAFDAAARTVARAFADAEAVAA